MLIELVQSVLTRIFTTFLGVSGRQLITYSTVSTGLILVLVICLVLYRYKKQHQTQIQIQFHLGKTNENPIETGEIQDHSYITEKRANDANLKLSARLFMDGVEEQNRDSYFQQYNELLYTGEESSDGADKVQRDRADTSFSGRLFQTFQDE